jgi:hypothetical protein
MRCVDRLNPQPNSRHSKPPSAPAPSRVSKDRERPRGDITPKKETPACLPAAACNIGGYW